MNFFSLDQILNRDPVIVNPTTPLIEIIGQMNQSSVANCNFNKDDYRLNQSPRFPADCILVMADSKLVGIFTKSDLVRLIAEDRTLAEMSIDEAMTQPVTTFLETEVQDLSAILNLINQHKIHHLPILDKDNQLLGIITHNSLLQALETKEMYGVDTLELDELYNHTPCGYHFLDSEGRFVRINDTELKMLGYSREEVLGRKFSDLITSESLITFQSNFPNLPERGWVRDIEFQLIRKNGTILPVALSATAVKDKTGNFLMSRSIVIDISERKQVEFALWETQHQLQAILNNSPAVIYLIDSENRHLLVNRSYAKLLSTTPESLSGKSIYQVWSTEFADTFAANNQQVLQGNQAIEVEEIVPHADELHTYITIKFPLHDAKGIPYAVCGISTDITERKLSEEKIREQATLIDIASDAIFVRDLSNQILFWNQGAERLYGWKAEEVRNRVVHELSSLESLVQLETALNITINQGKWNGELKQLTKDGREIIVASRWTLMYDQQNNPQSILVVNTDITEKKQLERQLLHAQRLESIGTLAGGIAHDLNNILTPIVSLAQLLPLKIPNLDESTLQLLTIVRNSALRGTEIIQQVLQFSRETETVWQSVILPQLLEEVLKLIRETFPKSIIIEEYISPNLWQVHGDSTQLNQVLMNLCVNARDAMPNGGKLVISAENIYLNKQYSGKNSKLEIGNYILITVTDTGIGIPKNIIDRIFDPFFTTKEPGQGTGLGLSTTIGIVKNHGGAIEVESEPEKGTQFQIYLPASEAIAITEAIFSKTIPVGQGELILVVDDEVPIREVTKATLETHNYQVITANDGLEAIAVYAQHHQVIEVVLMDLTMPEMDGLTAMRALKKINPHVKLIATSGLATKEKITTAESIGIKAFLVKPYTAEKLLLILSKAVGN
ncbi:two-component hybrid sensor and regulator [Stanieria sp. NIES-3757]|nr:two-component hybrid sensor and regulator [Stanieria sp. NIES-3757]